MKWQLRLPANHTRARRAGAWYGIAGMALAALFSTACDVHGVSDAGTLSAIVVAPNITTLAVGATQQFTAVGTDFAGVAVNVKPDWSVASGGGTISSTGVFTAGNTPGTYVTVKATNSGVSNMATVVIVAGPLASISILPEPVAIASGASQQFVAVGKDVAGNVVPLTPTWSVVAGGGTVSETGLFTAGSTAGTYVKTVQVSSGGMTGAATVTVTPGPLAAITIAPTSNSLAVGGEQQYTAVGTDAAGNVVPIVPTWSVTNGGGTITDAGLFTAGIVPGTFANTIKVSSGLVSSTATVSVMAGPLATITVSPNPASLAVGATQQFTAVGKDASGNVVPLTATWSVVNGGGTISTGGLFTAGAAPGSFPNTVRVSSGNVVGTTTVNVLAGPLATITVTPNSAALGVRSTQQFAAVGRDASGNVVAFTPVWSVTDGGGTITTTGLFTAGTRPGTFTGTVTASGSAVSGTATVVIVAGPLATITITPNPATLRAGATQQFTAVGTDSSGNVVPLTAAAWSVVSGGGTINSSGQFTAGAAPGTFGSTVRVTSGGIVGSATVHIVGGPLATLTLSPNAANVGTGGQLQFTAVGRDASGNAVPVTPVWAVVNGGGTINAEGLFTAGPTPGTFTNTVSATSDGISSAATVTVSAGALADIVVSPSAMTVAGGTQQQFTAVGRDASGNPVAITPVWSVVNGGGSIDAGTGMFTAGPVAGTFANTVRATSRGVSGSATVTVAAAAPSVATITVSPNPSAVQSGTTQQFTAVGRDSNGTIIPFTPVWSVVNGGGTINAATGVFMAAGVPGTFLNTVRASSGPAAGAATVTVTTGLPSLPLIDLGLNRLNGITAATGVSCVAGGIVNADIAIWPGNALSGFTPCVSTGTQHLNDGLALQAQLDLTNTYNTLAGLACPSTNAIVADLGNTVKVSGVYCSATSIAVTGVLTLDGNGNPNAVFIFQAATSLIAAGEIQLLNGAQAKNVYWQVGNSATLGAGSQWQGNIIAVRNISFMDNATLLGRALSRLGAVTLGTNNIITVP